MKTFLSVTMLSVISFSGVFAQTIHDRRVDQQNRIADGIESGKLTPAEAARLENKERRINGQIRDGREDHGGKLTAAEKRKINRQQNKVSKDIYKQKHDGPNQ